MISKCTRCEIILDLSAKLQVNCSTLSIFLIFFAYRLKYGGGDISRNQVVGIQLSRQQKYMAIDQEQSGSIHRVRRIGL